MPRPQPTRRPFAEFVAARGPEIARTLRAVGRRKGRLPTGLTDDDVFQHAMTETKRRYTRMADEDAAVKFAIKVGTNFMIDEYRAEQARASEAWRASVVARSAPPANTEQEALARIRSVRLGEGLIGLPTRQRRAIELVYFERLTRKQAAAFLGVSESTVKGLLQRALASLREHMRHSPALAPFVRLRKAVTIAAATSPRLFAAMLTLTVLSLPAPMVSQPNAEAFIGPRSSEHVERLPGRRAPAAAASRGATRELDQLVRGAARAGPDGRFSSRQPTPKRPKRVTIGAKVGDEQVGRFGGDELCVATGTGQEPFPPCANQNLVGMCPLARRLESVIGPYTTCERHSEPVYEPPVP